MGVCSSLDFVWWCKECWFWSWKRKQTSKKTRCKFQYSSMLPSLVTLKRSAASPKGSLAVPSFQPCCEYAVRWFPIEGLAHCLAPKFMFHQNSSTLPALRGLGQAVCCGPGSLDSWLSITMGSASVGLTKHRLKVFDVCIKCIQTFLPLFPKSCSVTTLHSSYVVLGMIMLYWGDIWNTRENITPYENITAYDVRMSVCRFWNGEGVGILEPISLGTLHDL